MFVVVKAAMARRSVRERLPGLYYHGVTWSLDTAETRQHVPVVVSISVICVSLFTERDSEGRWSTIKVRHPRKSVPRFILDRDEKNTLPLSQPAIEDTARIDMSAPTWNDLGTILLVIPLFLVLFCVINPFRQAWIMLLGRLFLRGLTALLLIFCLAMSLAGCVVSVVNLVQCLVHAVEDIMRCFFALQDQYLAYVAM